MHKYTFDGGKLLSRSGIWIDRQIFFRHFRLCIDFLFPSEKPVFNFLKGCHTVFISCQCHNAAHCKKDTHKQCRNDQECCDPCIKYLFSSLSSVSFPYAGALLLIHVIFCP